MGLNPTNACGCMIWKYMDQKGSAVMLVTKTLAGATPLVVLRNPLHAGEHWSYSPGSMLALKPRVDVTRNPKQGVSVAPRKGPMSSKKFLKSVFVKTASYELGDSIVQETFLKKVSRLEKIVILHVAHRKFCDRNGMRVKFLTCISLTLICLKANNGLACGEHI